MAKRPQHKSFDLQPNATTLQSATDLITEALFLINRSHRITLANNAAQTMTSLPESALLGQPIETILSLQLPNQRKKGDRIKLPSAELLTLTARVHALTHSATFLPLPKLDYFAKFTPRPAALVIVRPLSSPQMHDHTSATIYLQILGQLVMRIAHDLSNSLTSIIGNAELLNEQLYDLLTSPTSERIASLQDDGLPELNDVIRKSREMAEFINTLREYARQQPLNTQTSDLNTAINETLAIAKSLLGPKIQIEFLPSDALPSIYMDRLRIDQILQSVFITCKNAMPSGGRITIETERATLDEEFTNTRRGARPGTYTRLSITDSSPGMDSEQLQRIFDFPSPSESFDVAGLGLPIVYSIVKHVGGYIDVESWPGKGTRFDIYIPSIPPTTSTSSVAEKGVLAPRLVPNPQQSLILVAEDDSDIQRTIARYVSKAGYQTIFTADGKSALALYRQLTLERNQPILLIADLGLPGIDGRTLSKIIQQEFRSARILLTSGYKIDLDDTGKTPDGFNFLQKPFEPNGLMMTIEKILSTQQNSRRNQSFLRPGSPAKPGKHKKA
jgi:Signal transduction histidine kinase